MSLSPDAHDNPRPESVNLEYLRQSPAPSADGFPPSPMSSTNIARPRAPTPSASVPASDDETWSSNAPPHGGAGPVNLNSPTYQLSFLLLDPCLRPWGFTLFRCVGCLFLVRRCIKISYSEKLRKHHTSRSIKYCLISAWSSARSWDGMAKSISGLVSAAKGSSVRAGLFGSTFQVPLTV